MVLKQGERDALFLWDALKDQSFNGLRPLMESVISDATFSLVGQIDTVTLVSSQPRLSVRSR